MNCQQFGKSYFPPVQFISYFRDCFSSADFTVGLGENLNEERKVVTYKFNHNFPSKEG